MLEVRRYLEVVRIGKGQLMLQVIKAGRGSRVFLMFKRKSSSVSEPPTHAKENPWWTLLCSIALLLSAVAIAVIVLAFFQGRL
jgi:hypothetical protein